MFFDLKQSPGLVIVGLVLTLMTGCSATHTVENQTVAAVSEPKILDEPVALSRSFDARITKVQFFEGERSKYAFMADRKYETRFATQTTRMIYTEINFDYARPATKIDFAIRLFFRQNGRTLRIEEARSGIDPEWSGHSHVVGVGHFEAGKWPIGNYEVDVFVNAKKVATGYFEVYDSAKKTES